MLFMIGNYQVSVQRRDLDAHLQAQQEAQRLRLERQVESERRQAVLGAQQLGSLFH